MQKASEMPSTGKRTSGKLNIAPELLVHGSTLTIFSCGGERAQGDEGALPARNLVVERDVARGSVPHAQLPVIADADQPTVTCTVETRVEV